MSMPRFIALESAAVKKFVYFVEEEGDAHALLRASGETITSPYAKFEVERARSDERFVSIRSCYNNKYWVRTIRHEQFWIGCDANEPQENTSLRTCTLFEPVFTTVNDRNYIRLRFAFDGRYVTSINNYSNGQEQHGLSSSNIETNEGLFAISDWESLFILPKYVAFKSNNDKFLGASTINNQPHLQFTADAIGDPTVGDEVIHLRDGAVRVKSNHFDRFWRNTRRWISPDSDDTTANDLNTVFWPNRLSNNVVALRNLGNENFCKRLTLVGLPNLLSADVATIDNFTPMEVHETVLSRYISNVSFRLVDARVYDTTERTMAEGDAPNRSKEPSSITLRLRYPVTESRSFNSSVTSKMGVETTIRAGFPLIASGQITISAEFEGAVEWGSTSETTDDLETTFTATVPPMTALKVRLLATHGRCDVPFSYTQRDTLKSGHVSTTAMNDGVYRGANYFNFVYEVDEHRLSE